MDQLSFFTQADSVETSTFQSVSLPYEIRPSNRVKYAHIKVTPTGKVLVVIPRRFNVKHVPAFVAEHQQWIHKQLHRLPPHDPVYDSEEPQRIILRAIDETWLVHYNKPQLYSISNNSHEASHTKFRSVHINTRKPVRRQLLRWLNERAHSALGEQVISLGEETGLKPIGLTIRGQKTRWGSCSARKTLSLNRSLLFLPPAIVRYLIIHELCHIEHLNHSQKFWQLVQRFEPDYKRLDRSLANASRYIPHWALPE